LVRASVLWFYAGGPERIPLLQKTQHWPGIANQLAWNRKGAHWAISCSWRTS